MRHPRALLFLAVNATTLSRRSISPSLTSAHPGQLNYGSAALAALIS